MNDIDSVRVASYLAEDYRFVTIASENKTETLVMCLGIPIPQRMFFAFIFEYIMWAHIPESCDAELENLWEKYRINVGNMAHTEFARKHVRTIIAKFVSRKPTFLESKQMILDFCLDFQESELAPIPTQI